MDSLLQAQKKQVNLAANAQQAAPSKQNNSVATGGE